MNILVSIKYNTYDGELDCHIDKSFTKFTTLEELKEVDSSEYISFFKFVKRVLLDTLNKEQANAKVLIKVGNDTPMEYSLVASSERFGFKPSIKFGNETIEFENNNHIIKYLLKVFCDKYGVKNK